MKSNSVLFPTQIGGKRSCANFSGILSSMNELTEKRDAPNKDCASVTFGDERSKKIAKRHVAYDFIV